MRVAVKRGGARERKRERDKEAERDIEGERERERNLQDDVKNKKEDELIALQIFKSPNDYTTRMRH